MAQEFPPSTHPVKAFILSLLVTTAAFCLGTSGQAPGRLAFKTYGVAQGLENLSASRLAQDASGFIWIGTEGNIFRYDGSTFRAFGLPEGMPSGHGTALLPMPDGTVWIGTWRGLVRWRNGHLQCITPREGLPPDHILEVKAGPAGRLWVATPTGLFESPDGEAFQPTPGWPGGEASALCPGPEGGVWVASGSRLLHRTARNTWESPSPQPEVQGERIQGLVQDQAGRLWIRSSRHLLMKAPGTAGFQDLSHHVDITKDEGTLYLDRLDRLWVPTEKGLACLDHDRWTQVGPEDGLPTGRPRSVLLDREGDLWVAGDGIHRLLGRGLWRNFSRGNGLPHDVVWSVWRDPKGTLWTGTDQGLCRAVPGGWEAVPGTQDRAIRSVIQGPDGALWMGGSRAEVLRWLPGEGKVRHFGVEAGLRGTLILQLLLDHSGTLWVATDGGGVLRAVRRGGTWTFERETLPGGRDDERVSQLLEDGWHRLWACGQDGLACLEGGRWHRYTSADGLQDNHVAHLIQLRDSTFRLAYFEPRGLSTLEAPPGGFRVTGSYSRAQGLAGDKIYLLGEDSLGRLWVGSGHGVDVLGGPEDLHFDREEGMPGDDCDANAFQAEPGGAVWIGTSTGLGHYQPDALGQPAPPTCAVVEARLGSRLADLGPGTLVVDRSQNTLTIHYSSLSYLNEGRMIYQTLLLGLENEWLTTTQREARFPLLRPGVYEFRVRSKQPGGAWGPHAAFRFQVRPAWWQRWQALAAGLLALAGLIVAFVAWRVRALRRHNLTLERMVGLRTREVTLINTELQLAKERVERASAYKSSFLANMSHELRTPLNAILLYGELLLENAQDAGDIDAAQDLQRIIKSANHLLVLINGVLDLAKIEAGKMTLFLENVALGPFLADVAATLSPLARARGNRLEIRPDPTLEVLYTDPTKLRQVLFNLISNACKFTEKGKVVLEVRLAGEQVSFQIRDTGIGMSPEQCGRLFQEYVQAEGSTAGRYGGTGLGLIISRKICELMGGGIDLESQPGVGTVFTVTLPVVFHEEAPEGPVEPTALAAPAPGRPGEDQPWVLVVDDDLNTRKALEAVFRREAWRVLEAGDAAGAIAQCRERQPDLIMLELLLPGRDGFALVDELQGHPAWRKIPVLVLTAKDLAQEDRTRLNRAGIDQILQKGANSRQELTDIVHAFIRRHVKRHAEPPDGILQG